MKDFIETTQEKLQKYEDALQNDVQEFNSKLDLTRKQFSHYIDRQIQYLTEIKQQYYEEFDYLQRENNKTSQDNQKQFNKFCLLINQNDNRPIIVSKLFQEFKEKFPMRPSMLKSIPQYHFKDIQIDHLIIKENSPMSLISENNSSSSSSPLIDKSLSNEDNQFSTINQSTIIHTETSPFSTTSIGFSSHKKFASENNENDPKPEVRLASTCSTISESNGMLDIINKVPYQHSYNACLMCLNEDENYILIYTFSLDQFEYFSLNSGEIFSINCLSKQSILNVGYWRGSGLFYYSTRTNHFVLFRFNEEKKEIEIEGDINLIDEKDYFINVHIYQNIIYFLYLTSSKFLMLGKYHLENSSILPSISFEKKLYDYREKCPFKILDFTVNNSFICFLIQLKDNSKKFKIRICDLENLNEIHSFDLIDATRPISIISTEKKCESRMSNDDVELLLYINDPASRLIHCCTYEEYLIPARISHFGICSSNDGNLVLVTKEDIRILNLQDYLKTNKQFST